MNWQIVQSELLEYRVFFDSLSWSEPASPRRTSAERIVACFRESLIPLRTTTIRHESHCVLFSLYTTVPVEAVLNRLADHVQPVRVLIEQTTDKPDQTTRLGASLTVHGMLYSDATIAGSSEQTCRGDITAIDGRRRPRLMPVMTYRGSWKPRIAG